MCPLTLITRGKLECSTSRLSCLPSLFYVKGRWQCLLHLPAQCITEASTPPEPHTGSSFLHYTQALGESQTQHHFVAFQILEKFFRFEGLVVEMLSPAIPHRLPSSLSHPILVLYPVSLPVSLSPHCSSIPLSIPSHTSLFSLLYSVSFPAIF